MNNDELIGYYYKTMLLNNFVRDYVPTEENRLNRELKRLDIATKKKMLGIPLTDDDYEKSVNENKPFMQRPASLMAIAASKINSHLTRLPSLSAFEKPAINSIKLDNVTDNWKTLDKSPFFQYFKKNNFRLPINLADVYKIATKR
jgi:hypothetical protein